MAEIHDTGPISPRERKMYEKEYQQGAVLFEKALKHASKSDYAPQKHEFNVVMEKSMVILNQAAAQLKRQDLIEQNQQIAEHLQAFREHPTKQHLEELQNDLKSAIAKIKKERE